MEGKKCVGVVAVLWAKWIAFLVKILIVCEIKTVRW